MTRTRPFTWKPHSPFDREAERRYQQPHRRLRRFVTSNAQWWITEPLLDVVRPRRKTAFIAYGPSADGIVYASFEAKRLCKRGGLMRISGEGILVLNRQWRWRRAEAR